MDSTPVLHMTYEWICSISGMILTRVIKIPSQKRLPNATSSHQESHTDCPGSEARPLWSEVGYTYSRGLVTDSCQMTGPFPNGFIWNSFIHEGNVLVSTRCATVFVSPLGKMKDTVTALGGIPTTCGHLGDLSINSSDLFGEIQNSNFYCNFNP
jgi:hypothetical protein